MKCAYQETLENDIHLLLSTASRKLWRKYGSGDAILVAFIASLDNHRGMDVMICFREWLKTGRI